jgi:hypothetical protein
MLLLVLKAMFLRLDSTRGRDEEKLIWPQLCHQGRGG